MNLIQLFLKNQAKPRNFRSVSNEGETPTIYLYDIIGSDWYGGVSAQAFASELNALRNEPIVHLRINSPGGDVFEARAIATALQQFSGKVIAYIDGVAASAATWVALAADEVFISDGAFFMIHNSWTLAYGDKSVMIDTAALLDKIDGAIVADYVRATGKSEDEVRAWMNAETWFTAQEAVDNGFADQLTESKSKADNVWDLSAYKNAPKPEQKPTVDDNQIKQHREALLRNIALLERIAA